MKLYINKSNYYILLSVFDNPTDLYYESLTFFNLRTLEKEKFYKLKNESLENFFKIFDFKKV
jgi:hypothetical protein